MTSTTETKKTTTSVTSRRNGPRVAVFFLATRARWRYIGAALVVILLTTAQRGKAQSDLPFSSEEAAAIAYGEQLVFSVRASGELVLSEAELFVTVMGRDALVTSTSVTPGTTITVTETLSVEELQLPPVATLEYQWRFEDSAGQQYQGEIFSLRYEDDRVPWQWTPTSENGITVYTNGADRTVAQAALAISDEAVLQAERTLGRSVNRGIVVYVYPELAALANSLRTHQLRVRDWVAAYAIPDQNTVLVSAESGPELLVTLQRDLPHEIMHLAVFGAANGRANNVPAWFNEGLALNSSPEPDATLAQILYEGAENRTLPSIEMLCIPSFEGFTAHDAALAYAKSASLVQYISDRYGASQIGALMTGYGDGLSCGGAVERALGISLADMESQWLAHIGNAAADAPRSTSPSLAPWLIAWGISLVLALLFIFPQPTRHDDQPVYGTQVSLKPVPPDDSTQ